MLVQIKGRSYTYMVILISGDEGDMYRTVEGILVRGVGMKEGNRLGDAIIIEDSRE